jgi:uncharacterized lipoprotein
VKRVFVQVRDPRAAAYSLPTMARKFDENGFRLDMDFVTTVRMNVEWIEAWIKCRNETRYERGPMILTSNQSFGGWGEVFGEVWCRRRRQPDS